jgi:hypothetical protein
VSTVPEQHIPVEITVASETEERPAVEAETRIDVSVNGELFPTARLADGRYIAWWFNAREDAPAPDDPLTTEWVTAPTRFLAAATICELWEDPKAFDTLTNGSE